MFAVPASLPKGAVPGLRSIVLPGERSMRMKTLFPKSLFLALGLSLVGAVPALSQATDATIRGIVTNTAGDPLPGAAIQLRNQSTGFTARAVVDPSGLFVLRQLPLGGPYELLVSNLGYTSESRTGFQLGLGDRLEFAFRLQQGAIEVEGVVVTAPEAQIRIDRLGASRTLSQEEIARIPTPDRNFTNLAALSPQMGRGVSIGGSRVMSTNVTIDGANARRSLTGGVIAGGPFALSMEAIREFEVSTNNYDVTQGRQGGGGINAVTRSGSNTFEGSVFTYHRDNSLRATEDFQGRSLADFSTTQWGFSVGGPVIRDRLHFFAALDRQDQTIPRFINDLSTPDQERQFRISRQNFERVIDIVERQYGMPELEHSGEFLRKTTANAFFARLDYQISDNHTLTFRNNYTDWLNPLNGSGDQSLSLRESIWNFNSRENSALLSLRSSLGPNFTNELKLQHQYGYREFELPAGKIPRAFVRVESVLDDGTPVTTQVQFGGHRWAPEVNEEQYVQLANTSYLNRGNHALVFGFDVMPMYMENWISNEQGGLFRFDSLEDLEQRRPSAYFRQQVLNPDPFQRYWVLDSGIFGQVEFRPLPNVRAELGARWDVTSFLTRPEYNPLVEQELGFRTDVAPTDFTGLQPRAQFTWDVGGRGSDILRIGGGAFKSHPHYFIHMNNTLNTGLQVATLNLDRRRGDAIPDPDFDAFRRDIANNPGIAPGTSTDDLPPPFIHSIRDDYKTPMTWKGNVSYNRLWSDRIRTGANLLYSRTVNNYHYFDANLREQPFFTTDPDNRPVWVPASSVNPANGNTSMIFSRRSNRIDHAMVFNNEAGQRQVAAVVDAYLRLTDAGASVSGSYTWNRTEDTSSYNCCQWTTALHNPVQVDPRRLEWAPSDNDFRHKFVFSGSTPLPFGFNLTASYVGISGTPFSLLVSGDIDGTGSPNNDLAFIFDPNDPSTPAAIRDGMNNAIARARPNVAAYLRENAGQRASRNGVRNEFSHLVNTRMEKRFALGARSMDLTLDVYNLLHLINDEWGGIHNFGGSRRLLTVTGFDADQEQFRYRVNENVGEVPRSGDVYQIQLGVRMNF
jgi:hypothetical protein